MADDLSKFYASMLDSSSNESENLPPISAGSQFGSSTAAPNEPPPQALHQDDPFAWMVQGTGLRPAPPVPATTDKNVPAPLPPATSPSAKAPPPTQPNPLARFASEEPAIESELEDLSPDVFSGISFPHVEYKAQDLLNTNIAQLYGFTPQEVEAMQGGDYSAMQQKLQQAHVNAMYMGIGFALEQVNKALPNVLQQALQRYGATGQEMSLKQQVNAKYPDPNIASLIYSAARTYRTQFPKSTAARALAEGEKFLRQAVHNMQTPAAPINRQPETQLL